MYKQVDCMQNCEKKKLVFDEVTWALLWQVCFIYSTCSVLHNSPAVDQVMFKIRDNAQSVLWKLLRIDFRRC